MQSKSQRCLANFLFASRTTSVDVASLRTLHSRLPSCMLLPALSRCRLEAHVRPFRTTWKLHCGSASKRGAPLRSFATAAEQPRTMGFWPSFSRQKNATPSKLQALLEAATAFSRQPCDEALRGVEAALGELCMSFKEHCIQYLQLMKYLCGSHQSTAAHAAACRSLH